ncbi:MAG: GNAT family N-acetyltransferase [Candidatus Kariarchaeaceae archaeon]|jgi:GNAT superfamily N-acetyltransferase
MKALSLEGLRNSLEILYPVTLVMEKRFNRIQLDLIQVDEKVRGKGIGREIMERIISYSDLHRTPIELTPSGKFGSSKRKLKKFYKELGFVKNSRRSSTSHYDLIRHCESMRIY